MQFCILSLSQLKMQTGPPLQLAEVQILVQIAFFLPHESKVQGSASVV